MRKKKKKTRLEKRPFTSEKGKNPQKTSEEKKKKKKKKTRSEVGFRSEPVTLRLARGCDLGLKRTWVALRT